MRVQGAVHWWKDEKGYGRITGDDGVLYFAHFSDIEADGYRSLEEGQRVSFEWDGERMHEALRHAGAVRSL